MFSDFRENVVRKLSPSMLQVRYLMVIYFSRN